MTHLGIVRDRADARWLPSRSRYALARLIAYLRARRSPPAEVRGMILPIDRDQNAAEIYSVAAWMFLTTSCYAGELLARRTAPAVAALAAAPLALLLLHAAVAINGFVVMPLAGAVLRRRSSNHTGAASTNLMLLFFAATAYFATVESWVRFAAWTAIVVAGLNTFAAVVLHLIHDSVDALERRCAT